MPSKYIQLGAVSSVSNYVFEYVRTFNSNYYEYVNNNNGTRRFIYQRIGDGAILAVNSGFTQATSSTTTFNVMLGTKSIILREPVIHMDPAQCPSDYGTSVWNPGMISATSTYTGTFTVSTAGNYLISINGSCGSIRLTFSTSGTSYTTLTENIFGDNYGCIYYPIYLMDGKYQIVINTNDNDEINIASGAAQIKLMPQNLVVDNHMLPYLSRSLFYDSDSDDSIFYQSPVNWASPAKIYGTSWSQIPYQNCTAGSLNGKFEDVRQDPSIILDSNQLSSIKNYYCCAHRIRVWMPFIVGQVRSVTIKDPVSKLSNTITAPGVSADSADYHYFYDIPGILQEFWWPNIPSTLGTSINVTSSGVSRPDFTNNTTAYKQTSLLLCRPGSNQYVISSCSVYQIGQLSKNVVLCTSVYFAIEMAVKLSNGRTVRVKPLSGQIYFYANGVFFYSNAVNASNWTAYTSADDKTRQVYRWSGISAKNISYVNGFHISSGGYINITGTYTTVYGSSGSSSGSTYAGKYTIGTTTTASGHTFSTTALSDPSKKRVGFKILSGF